LNGPVNRSPVSTCDVLTAHVSVAKAEDRANLCRQFDTMRCDLDTGDTMARMDRYHQQALEIVRSGKAQQAFRIDRESDRVRDAYGRQGQRIQPGASAGHREAFGRGQEEGPRGVGRAASAQAT
jgi:hypothetical protein